MAREVSELDRAWVELRQGTLIPQIGDMVRAVYGQHGVTGAWADDGPEDLDDPRRYSLDCGVFLWLRAGEPGTRRFRIVVEVVDAAE